MKVKVYAFWTWNQVELTAQIQASTTVFPGRAFPKYSWGKIIIFRPRCPTKYLKIFIVSRLILSLNRAEGRLRKVNYPTKKILGLGSCGWD
jgi:hypothetical protein